jgi:hypothetical protein
MVLPLLVIPSTTMYFAWPLLRFPTNKDIVWPSPPVLMNGLNPLSSYLRTATMVQFLFNPKKL